MVLREVSIAQIVLYSCAVAKNGADFAKIDSSLHHVACCRVAKGVESHILQSGILDRLSRLPLQIVKTAVLAFVAVNT